MKICCTILLLVGEMVAPPVGSQVPLAIPKPTETTVCEIAQNPAIFNNKLVKVGGYVSVSFESSTLSDEGCSDAIWFALADGTGLPGLVAFVNGKGKPGGNNPATGATTPPLAVKLVRDANFEKFVRYMSIKEAAKPCIDDPTKPTSPDCGVYRITATFTGRIDSVSKEVHEEHLKRSPSARPDFKGFGHMGSFDAQLVVECVENVHVVDLLGREKP